MICLLIATRNAHKVGEIRAILGDGFHCLSLKDFPTAPAVVEDAATFAGNATKKAEALARWLSGVPRSAFRAGSRCIGVPSFIVADDSGLEVDALNGAPGVHSARFAAQDSEEPGNSPDADNNAKLLRLLTLVPWESRTGRFCCVLALTPVLGEQNENASPVCYAEEFELQTQVFRGACEGRILAASSGAGGFGYDPLFVPDGFEKSFAGLGEDIKNQLSHRAKALEKLKAHFSNARQIKA